MNMKEKAIYGNLKNLYSGEIQRLNASNISPRNKELILAFHSALFSKGIGQTRVSKLSWILRNIALELKIDFDIAKTEHIEQILGFYAQKSDYAPETRLDYRKTLKQFYKWLKTRDNRLESEDLKVVKERTKFYHYVESIQMKHKIKSLDYSNIISEEEIDKVVESGCKSYKEKAIVKFLHETGCRVGELLNMRIKDIHFKDNHALARLDGKTGERRVFILHSLPLLTRWFELHPFKDNPDAYLWIGENRKYMYERLSHKGGQKLLDRCFERANLKHKKRNFHWFRHSRATLLAPHLSEVVLCDYMGWTRGSNQIKRYVHLCAKQVESVFLQLNGLVAPDQNKNNPIKCSCTAINEHNARYCFRCGKPLSVEIAIVDENKKKIETDKTIQFLMEIMQNPELLARYQEFKEKLNKMSS